MFRHRFIGSCVGTSLALLCSHLDGATWNLDGSANWNVNANWTSPSTFPNSIDAVAIFGGAITAARNITLGQAITVGTITFDSNNKYTIQSGGSLVLDVASGSALVSVASTDTSDQTISANIALNDNLLIRNDSSSLLSLSGVISGSSKSLTLLGIGEVALSGANTYSGSTILNAGTLTLSSIPTSGRISTSSSLTMGGGTLDPVFQTDGVQSFSGLTLSAGASSIVTSGASAAHPGSLNLNAVTRNAGATIDFTIGANAPISTSSGLVNGLLGGYATVAGANWATIASTKIQANTSYADINLGGTIANVASSNVRINGGTSGNIGLGASLTTINTLLQNVGLAATIDTAAKTLRLGAVGGVLIPSGKGGLTIGTSQGSGTLTAGGGTGVAGDLVFINNSSELLTVNSVIANNGIGVAVSVTKAGFGTLILAGANSYTGGTTISKGAIQLGADSALGSGSVTFAGGTLDAQSHTATVGALSLTAGSISTIQLKPLDGIRGILTFTGAPSAGTSSLLRITGWRGTGGATGTADANEDQIFISTGGSSFAANDVIFVDINGIVGNNSVGFWRSDTHELVPLSAVPEPSTVLAGCLILGWFGWSERRRIRVVLDPLVVTL